MKKSVLIALLALVAAAPVAAARGGNGPTLTANSTAASGCGYPSNSTVIVWVHSKQSVVPTGSGHLPHNAVNFETVPTDSNGCFSITYSAFYKATYEAAVFYSPTGTNPFEAFTSTNFRGGT